MFGAATALPGTVACWLAALLVAALLPAETFGRGRCARTRIRVALAAPPMAVVFSRGDCSSPSHIAKTALSGRSWVIRRVTKRVTAIVMTRAQAAGKKPK